MRVRVLFMVLSITIFAFGLAGCKSYTSTKKFLFDNPDIKFQINGKGEMYDLYTYEKLLKTLECNKQVIVFYIGQETYEILLTGDEQRIGKTKYLVKANTGL